MSHKCYKTHRVVYGSLLLFWVVVGLFLTGCSRPLSCTLEENSIGYQTPQETLARGGGVCEDFAVLEFFNNDAEWMVQGYVDGQHHMWAEDAEGNILDQCYRGGVRVERIRFNSTTYKKPNGETGDAMRIPKLRNLVERLKGAENG